MCLNERETIANTGHAHLQSHTIPVLIPKLCKRALPPSR
jgi:hypothetical protein